MDGWMDGNVPRMIRFDYCFGLASLCQSVFHIVKRRKRERERERAKQKGIASPSVKSLVHSRHLSVGGESLDTLCILLLLIIQKCFLWNWLWAELRERRTRQPLELVEMVQLQNLIQFNKHWNNSSERLHRTTTTTRKKKKKEEFFLK